MSKSNRVLDLYQALQNGQVINKKEAAEQFCVNEKSIQRDLDSIRAVSYTHLTLPTTPYV